MRAHMGHRETAAASLADTRRLPTGHGDSDGRVGVHRIAGSMRPRVNLRSLFAQVHCAGSGSRISKRAALRAPVYSTRLFAYLPIIRLALTLGRYCS